MSQFCSSTGHLQDENSAYPSVAALVLNALAGRGEFSAHVASHFLLVPGLGWAFFGRRREWVFISTMCGLGAGDAGGLVGICRR
jgi:hypothetical protein